MRTIGTTGGGIALLCALFFALPQPLPAAEEGLIIEHGSRSSKKVALTFDACPTGRPDEYDKGVIDVLVREQVPATLFLSGRWVKKNRTIAAELAARPQFEIAAHSYFHPHLTKKDDDRVLREMQRTQEMVRKATGRTPRYFRPPYGEVDERIARIAAKAGLVTIQYDIASGDPDPSLPAERISRAVVREARGGSIVVFHMNGNGKHTAELLPAVIDGLRQRGFTLVTVGELLASPK
jgi:peptidoglycan/xylan/chitin deacetylase (PgdA/CDA1 family)